MFADVRLGIYGSSRSRARPKLVDEEVKVMRVYPIVQEVGTLAERTLLVWGAM
jgi:hypothetical protein